MDMVDIANGNIEAAMIRADVQRERDRVRAKLQAMASGGWCVDCDRKIPEARLAAVDTDLCVDCAELKETTNS